MKQRHPNDRLQYRETSGSKDSSAGSESTSQESWEKPYNFRESNCLEILVAEKIPVLVRLRNNKDVVGLIENHNSTSIRLSQREGPILHISKDEIKYFFEQPEKRS